MKKNGVLLTLLTVVPLLLFLSQNLQAEVNRAMHDTGCKIQDNRELCIEDRASKGSPKSETCGEQSRTIQNPQLDKAEFALKTMKLHMPFIANNGQVDGRVKFYAKTFGGTVFVTKEGEIVYALPMNSSELRVQGSECRGEWHSPNVRYDKVGTLHNHHISDIVHPASWIVDHDKPEILNPKSAIQNDAVRHLECNEGSLF